MDASKLESLLKGLGTTAEEVASTLRDANVTGNHCGGTCPVSNYLRSFAKEVGFTGVNTGCDNVAIWNVTYSDTVKVDLPRPVWEFIRRFDGQGEFTFLYEGK